jgi:hypothetical protein
MLRRFIAATLALGFTVWPAAAGPVDGEWACKPLMGVDPVAWIDITEDGYALRAKTGSGDGRIAFEAEPSSFANFDVLSGPLLDFGASTGSLASRDPPRLMLRGDTGIFFMCEPAKP